MTRNKNNSIEMKEIRNKIDKVDTKILPLMVKRSELVKKALSLKKKKPIDFKLIKEVLGE